MTLLRRSFLIPILAAGVSACSSDERAAKRLVSAQVRASTSLSFREVHAIADSARHVCGEVGAGDAATQPEFRRFIVSLRDSTVDIEDAEPFAPHKWWARSCTAPTADRTRAIALADTADVRRLDAMPPEQRDALLNRRLLELNDSLRAQTR